LIVLRHSLVVTTSALVAEFRRNIHCRHDRRWGARPTDPPDWAAAGPLRHVL